jgi:hypothetical protein
MYKFYLKIFVILGAILFTSLFLYNLTHKKQIMYEDDSDRNENSTPRSFILPATPAVAIEQENRSSNSNNYQLRICCMKKLDLLNYDVGDELVEFNAKLKVAIYEFQKTVNLNPTGMLDKKTIEALGC